MTTLKAHLRKLGYGVASASKNDGNSGNGGNLFAIKRLEVPTSDEQGEPLGTLNPLGFSEFPRLPEFPRINQAGETAQSTDGTWEERAAIAEYDGGLPRPHAEVLAALSMVAVSVEERGVLDRAAMVLEEITHAHSLEGTPPSGMGS